MIKPIKPEVFQMEISGYTQTLRITSSSIFAELHYDDGQKLIYTMGGTRLNVNITVIQEFIAHLYTSTHTQGKATGIETFLDAVATEYLQRKLF